jgi:hypothetical protein
MTASAHGKGQAARSQRTPSFPLSAAVRLIALYVAVIAAALLGFELASSVGMEWTLFATFAEGWLIIAAVLVILIVGTLLLSLPDIFRFIRCGTRFLAAATPALAVLLLMLAIAGFSVRMAHHREEDPQPSPAPLGIFFGYNSRNDTIYVPFFRLEGRNLPNKPCDPNQTDFGDAASLDAYAGLRQAISDLGQALASCSTPVLPVVIDVRGYASTSEFKDHEGTTCDAVVETKPDRRTVSEQLNLQLAEARRTEVIRLVTESSGQAIRVDPPGPARWNDDPQRMRDALGFFDRSLYSDGAPYNATRGMLNRRAEIEILSKGACEPRTVPVLQPDEK